MLTRIPHNSRRRKSDVLLGPLQLNVERWTACSRIAFGVERFFLHPALKLARCPLSLAPSLVALPSMSSIETLSLPALTRCYLCSFTFYLGNPLPRFLGS
jgi:hypothetical protein